MRRVEEERGEEVLELGGVLTVKGSTLREQSLQQQLAGPQLSKPVCEWASETSTSIVLRG